MPTRAVLMRIPTGSRQRERRGAHPVAALRSPARRDEVPTVGAGAKGDFVALEASARPTGLPTIERPFGGHFAGHAVAPQDLPMAEREALAASRRGYIENDAVGANGLMVDAVHGV